MCYNGSDLPIMSQHHWQKSLWLISFALLWLLFSVATTSFLDPDFGWHFRTGEWIWLKRQIPRTDLFSYTMPNHPWRYPAWLTELMFYSLYEFLGYSGLAIFMSFWAALAFMLGVFGKEISYAIFPLILATVGGLDSISVRPKIFSLFLGSLIFLLLRRSAERPKRLLVLPPLFLIWANLHGGFALGLFVFLWFLLVEAYLIVKGVRKIASIFPLALLSWLLSVAATLINPFGWRVYEEVFATVTSRELQEGILEWMPTDLANLWLLVYVAGFWLLLRSFRKQVSYFEVTTALLLLLAGIMGRRLFVYFLLFGLPLYAQLLGEAYRKLRPPKRYRTIGWQRGLVLLTFLFPLGFSTKEKLSNLEDISEAKYYPSQAVVFLQNQAVEGNLFSVYNWGGYLIWKFPQKKVFVDGRMASWRDNGYSAFEQAQNILTGAVDYQPVFEDYQITTVLLPLARDRKTLADKLLFDGWQRVYQDQRAQILLKPQ